MVILKLVRLTLHPALLAYPERKGLQEGQHQVSIYSTKD